MTDEANTIRSLLYRIVIALIDDPTHLAVTVEEEPGAITLRLFVGANDISKVIGIQGRTARATRIILNRSAMKMGVRCQLEIASWPAEVTVSVDMSAAR